MASQPLQPGCDGISIVSAALMFFFLGSFREFCTLGGWSERGTRSLSTQLPRLPEVGQHAPPSLSKLPDCMGCGQADVSNLH